MAKDLPPNVTESMDYELEEESEDEELEGWDDWEAEKDDVEEGDSSDSDFLCFFCDSKYGSCDALFEHCSTSHRFDFRGIRTSLGLDFYGAFKLINYVRSQVANNRCWSCGVTCQSNQDLQNHLHETVNLQDIKSLWEDDRYLKPFMKDDSLLYSFGEDEEGEDNCTASVDKEELMRDLENFEEISIDDENAGDTTVFSSDTCDKNGGIIVSASNDYSHTASSLEKVVVNGVDSREHADSSVGKLKDKPLRASFPTLIAKDIKNVNKNYFGAYSSFGIHREMISDKVRTDAYRQAILKNPSLLNNAVVMDVGCGTGILSLFAAQAGASRVIAIDASEKMATVATQIAMDNGLWQSESQNEGNNKHPTGVIKVVHGMVEELDKSLQVQPQSVDVLLSEWMGYCLLYESMLSSVLFARDRWLKPGGAILPDTATIFVAGFGKGGTSLPFWENVYGFNMSCVGKELVGDAAQIPIVDIVDDKDIVTSSAVLQTFDLATMKPDGVDFTASAVLESLSNDVECRTKWCYGVVLWFETGFTSRFCKEMPVVLSTSPYTPKTHWSQTILTFQKPIAIASAEPSSDTFAAVGTEACPATKIHLRISIARAVEHRSIDISLETAGIGPDGRKHKWPAQLFTLH
ncbi:hypothetical protein FH972_010945 [Carpinus fangiana]|uniref:C2H2-type domain-containing protein n=1 Tax=Carpinus fangiana TaxID=176857 RepID=A0A660KRK7_9ROSI|nr:hypothetical protein FH972_010945 [Carpinus fangiana]